MHADGTQGISICLLKKETQIEGKSSGISKPVNILKYVTNMRWDHQLAGASRVHACYETSTSADLAARVQGDMGGAMHWELIRYIQALC